MAKMKEISAKNGGEMASYRRNNNENNRNEENGNNGNNEICGINNNGEWLARKC
jgi:hypothetical protein